MLEEPSEEVEERARWLIRRHRVVDIVKQVIRYRNRDLNEEVKVGVLSALKRHIEENKEESKGMVHIIEWWWGNCQKVLAEWLKQEEAKGEEESAGRGYYSQMEHREEEKEESNFSHKDWVNEEE